ncbi:MAG: hypothetical protein AAGA56_12880 [Myxococcota bacterium]
MNPIRTIALIASLVFTPALASAADSPDQDVVAARHKGKKKGKRGRRGAKNRPQFPMKGEAFTSRIDQRLSRIEARVARRLERSKLDDAAKSNVRQKVATAKAKVKAATRKAAADGTVTRQEAKEVRQIVKQLRKEAKQGRKDRRNKRRRGRNPA